MDKKAEVINSIPHTITINGKSVIFNPGETILDVAKRSGTTPEHT